MVSTAATPRLSIEQVTALVDEHFPQVHEGNGRIALEFLAPSTARLRMPQDLRSIRPGGTVSGPTMFKLADFSVYALLLAQLGEDALPAVTTSMTINFLSRPDAAADPAAVVRRRRPGRLPIRGQTEIPRSGARRNAHDGPRIRPLSENRSRRLDAGGQAGRHPAQLRRTPQCVPTSPASACSAIISWPS